jgi:hypothetical protein
MFFKEAIVETVRDARTAKEVHEKTIHVLKCGYHSLEFIDEVEVPMLSYAMKFWAMPWFRWRRGGPKKLFLEQSRKSTNGTTWMLIFLGEYGLYLHRTHNITFVTSLLIDSPQWAEEDPQNCFELLKCNYSVEELRNSPQLNRFVL